MRRIVAALGWCALVLSPGTLPAQESVIITGHVLTAAGAVGGASVAIPALGISTWSAGDGRYSLIVPSSRVHGQVVTLVARHRRFGVDSVSLRLTGGTLEQNLELRQAPPRAAVADSVPPSSRTVDSTDLEVAGPVGVAEALAGRIPGLDITAPSTPGGSSRIVWRGASSLSGSDVPLVVVDGVEVNDAIVGDARQQRGLGGFDYGGPIPDLPLEDISTIRMLSAAEAVARFGGRGAHGALIVSTRHARRDQRFDGSLSQLASSETMRDLASFQDTYGQGLGGRFEFFDGTHGINDGVDQSWGPRLDGRPVVQASLTEAKAGDVRPWLARPGNVRDFFDAARTLTTHGYASISGRNAGARASANWRSIAGLLPGNRLDRLSLGLNLDAGHDSPFTTSASFRFIDVTGKHRPGTGDQDANPMFGFSRFGRQVDVAALGQHTRDAASDPVSWNYVTHNNPYFQPYLNDQRDDMRQSLGSIALGWTPAPAVELRVRGEGEVLSGFRAFDVASGWIGGFPYFLGNGSFASGGYQRQRITGGVAGGEGSVTVHPLRNGTTRLDVTGGAGLREERIRSRISGTDSLYRVGDSTETTSAGTGEISPSLRSQHASAFGSAALSLGSVFSLQGAARNEWMSLLPSNERSQLSVAGSTSLSLLDAMPAMRGSAISSWLLHGSWTRGADDRAIRQLRLAALSSALGAAPSAIGSVGTIDPASRLRPEVTTSAEAGMRLGFAGGRVSLDATVYDEKTANQAFLGAGSAVITDGEVSNRGLETQILFVPLRSVSTEWSVRGSYSTNRNRVSALLPASVAVGPSLWGASVVARKGEPLGVIVGTRFLRDAAGRLLLRDGLPLADTLAGAQVLGSAAPRWTSALESAFRFRALEVSMLLDARGGGKFLSGTNMWGSASGVLEDTGFRPDSGLLISGIDVVTGEPNATHVSTEQYYHALQPIHEQWIYDATWIKLRDLRLTYSFEHAFTRSGRPSVLRLSLLGRNVFTWSRAPNVDPEGALSAVTAPGIEAGQLPGTRSVGVHLAVTP